MLATHKKQRRRKDAKTRPVTAGKRGPVAFEPTDEQREQVKSYVAGGMTQEEIADALNISRRSLNTHFAGELVAGRGVRKAEAIDQLRASAAAGKVAAQKELLRLYNQPAAAAEIASRKKLSQKAQRALDLLTLGENSEWAGPFGPNGEWENDLQPGPSAMSRRHIINDPDEPAGDAGGKFKQ
jgi:hypothetical protein